MKVIKTKNYQEMSKKASEILLEELGRKPGLVVGFATGATQLGLYKELIGAYRKKKANFSRMTSFNLDEYYPIKKKDKKSFYYYMFKNFFSKVNIKKSNINLLNGEARDTRKECKDFERKIRKKKIDIQFLGVGINGHIGFNEPGSSFQSRTRLVNLSCETIKRQKVPKQALTMGISSILSARKIILLASGKKKAKAVSHLLKGSKSKEWPISSLKKHRNLVVILDKSAANFR